MKIRFVSHASIIVEINDICIISDPWLSGSIFYDGWSLLSKAHKVDWSKISHIWISHEHPDHFHVPSLKSIPEEFKSKITVMYQNTIDKKVVNWFKNNNFIVHELPRLKKIELAPKLFIKTGSTPQDDSWLLIDDGNTKFLNLNDCETKTKEFDFIMKNFRRQIGKVDILASQFAFASYLGSTKKIRLKSAKTVIEKVNYQIQVLKPKYFIPFASFSYFSHKENFYQNIDNNDIFDLVDNINEHSTAKPIVMYPGDIWKVGNVFSNKINLKKYANDYKKCLDGPLLDKTKIFNLDALCLKANLYRNKLLKNNILLFLFRPLLVKIWVSDLNISVSFDLHQGLHIIKSKQQECDVSISSDLIAGWFDNDYGGASAYISGRIYYDNKINYRKLYKYFYISNANNRGQSWPWFVIKNRVRARLLKTFYQDKF